jgi:hypothetical protein
MSVVVDGILSEGEKEEPETSTDEGRIQPREDLSGECCRGALLGSYTQLKLS